LYIINMSLVMTTVGREAREKRRLDFVKCLFCRKDKQKVGEIFYPMIALQVCFELMQVIDLR
jgi:hypothetical protein